MRSLTKFRNVHLWVCLGLLLLFLSAGCASVPSKTSTGASSQTAQKTGKKVFRQDSFSSEGGKGGGIFSTLKKLGDRFDKAIKESWPKKKKKTAKRKRVVLKKRQATPTPSNLKIKETVSKCKLTYPLPVYEEIVPCLLREDFKTASVLLKKKQNEFQKRNRLLYCLEKGIVDFYAHNYAESCRMLTEASRLDEELFTKSLTRQAGTFLVNDLMAPYRGEDYESVMINLFLALAYLQQKKVEDALVEARKVDAKLEAINAQYDEGKKNVYREDAFVRWLMGILYEIDPTSQNLNDALVSYRKALEIYRKDYRKNYRTAVPTMLKKNYLSMAKWAGEAEFREALRLAGKLPYLNERQKRSFSRVTILHFNGKSPVKIERSITCPLPDGHIIKVAFPKYHFRPFRIAYSEVRAVQVGTKRTYRSKTELGEPIARIAYTNLENRKARILAKAITRALIKYGATKAAQQEAEKQWGYWAGLLVGTLGDAYIVYSEKADLRGWLSLPAQIRITQLVLPPGTYAVQAYCYDHTGKPVKRVDLGTVTTRAGETRFLTFCTTR